MKILYVISKYATFFGALIKGLWEHIVCGILKIFVEDARYLQPNEMCGHVEHTLVRNRAKAFFVILLPSLINAFLAFFLCASGFMGLFMLKVSPKNLMFWVYIVLLYLGISFLCNIFPIVEDAINNWSLIYNTKLTDEEKRLNAEIKEKNKKIKEMKKQQKKSGKDKSLPASTPKTELTVIRSETNIVVKIILFIPSAILYAGAYLEKYAITFILSIAAVAAAFFLF